MKVLITGHRGFVGGAFVEYLTSEEGQEWALRMHRGAIGAVVGVDIADPVRPLDCRTYFDRSAAYGVTNWSQNGTHPGERDEYFDLVIHCAAVIGGRTMIEGDPLTLAAEDLSIDAALWRWAKRTKPGRIVYFSSSAAYPISLQAKGREWKLRETDIDLETAAEPDQTYGWVKLTGERMAALANATICPVHVFRPFSGYGEAQAKDYPWPAFLQRAREHADPFDVWGDGRQVRDFVHIQDIVLCVLEALARDERGPVNICTGRPTSFLQLARLFIERAGYEQFTMPPEMRTDPDRPSGVRYRVGDPAEMRRFYQPQVSLEQAIELALGSAPVVPEPAADES